jgi:regulation of enolase protein 1 (concanavalin A-like superfamily)
VNGKLINGITLLIVIVFVLTACNTLAPVTAEPPAEIIEAEPVDPPAAQPEEAEPAEEPAPVPTATPEGQFFRDDFTDSIQPGWEWENENPAKWTITSDGWLEIIGETESLLGDEWQSNLLWYQLPEGDFVITAHLKTKPFENFHQATVYIYEDPENYIAINRGYCDICELTKGNGIYMEYKIDSAWGGYQKATDAEDVYLRLESSNDMISGYYAFEEGQWERLGRFGNYFEFNKVGIGVSNVNSANDVVGMFDYFEITRP